ncbi:MAG: sugar kinase [Anaerolineae bacterium]
MRFGVTGEVSQDRLSQPGVGIWQGLGGCAVYLALGLGRLGAEVIFATAIGDDLNTAWLEPLRQAGVELHLRRLAGPTARLDLAYDHKGDIARLRFVAGVERCLDADQLPSHFWSADWILVGTGPRAYQTSVVQQAHARDRLVSLSTQREFQGAWDSLLALLPHLDVLFINSGEVTGLRGDRLPVGLDALHNANPRMTCVVTCGERGAFLLHNDWLFRVTACPGQIVNTTGAGDAFGAAWLFTFAQARDPAYALRVASVAAALTLEGVAHTSLPDWSRIEGALQDKAASLQVERWPASSAQALAALMAEDAHCHRVLDRRVVRS